MLENFFPDSQDRVHAEEAEEAEKNSLNKCQDRHFFHTLLFKKIETKLKDSICSGAQ